MQKQLSASPAIDSEVLRKSEMALRVQKLTEEFGRLKEEHRLLEIERQTLHRCGVVVVPALRGKVKKG